MHYLLIYDLAEDYLARRAEYRNQHLALAWAASGRGELVLGGALADPSDQAILLFEGDPRTWRLALRAAIRTFRTAW